MNKYTTWLKTAAIFQFIFMLIHTATLFVSLEPSNETERQLFTLMDTYKFDLGAGFHRTMGELMLVSSAGLSLLCFLAGSLNWYLLHKKVKQEVIKGVIMINLIAFGIFLVLSVSFAFLLPIVLLSLIFLLLFVSLLTIRKDK